jgi:hypothetical protein
VPVPTAFDRPRSRRDPKQQATDAAAAAKLPKLCTAALASTAVLRDQESVSVGGSGLFGRFGCLVNAQKPRPTMNGNKMMAISSSPPA